VFLKTTQKELAIFIFCNYALRLLNRPCFGCKNRTRSNKTPQCQTPKAERYLKCNGVRFFKLFVGLFGLGKETRKAPVARTCLDVVILASFVLAGLPSGSLTQNCIQDPEANG